MHIKRVFKRDNVYHEFFGASKQTCLVEFCGTGLEDHFDSISRAKKITIHLSTVKPRHRQFYTLHWDACQYEIESPFQILAGSADQWIREVTNDADTVYGWVEVNGKRCRRKR